MKDDAVEVVPAGEEHETVDRGRSGVGSSRISSVPLEVTIVAVYVFRIDEHLGTRQTSDAFHSYRRIG